MSDTPWQVRQDWLALAGRVCAVTGAGGGIGAEVARQLLVEGARVALLDLDEARMAQALRDWGVASDRAIAVHCDVAQQESVQAAADAVQAAWGPATLLCALAVGLFIWLVDPAPPKVIVMSAGPKDSTLLPAAEAYREILARNGITLKVLTSAGSVQNLQRLLDPK